jgi:hypothetical protein
MLKVKIDGVVEDVEFNRENNGWTYYNVIRNGSPISEISVPCKLDNPFVTFRTGGHRFERVVNRPEPTDQR